jgi:hypothetical protein
MVEPDANHGGLGRCHSPLTVTLGVYIAGRRMVAARWFLEGARCPCRRPTCGAKGRLNLRRSRSTCRRSAERGALPLLRRREKTWGVWAVRGVNAAVARGSPLGVRTPGIGEARPSQLVGRDRARRGRPWGPRPFPAARRMVGVRMTGELAPSAQPSSLTVCLKREENPRVVGN